MKKEILAVGAAVVLSLATMSAAQAALVATYEFDNSFAANEAAAAAIVPLNGGNFVTDTVFGQSRTVYQRYSASNASSAQSALRLDTASLGLASNNYAVELVFSFTDNISLNGYRRLVNAFDPASLADPGFYVDYNSHLNIYQNGPHSGGATLADGTYYDVVLSVSPGGEQAYVNGELAVAHGGTPDAIQSHYLNFFLDEVYEYTNGRVALLRIFDASLSGADVTALHNAGNPFAAPVPVPAAVWLFGSALGGLGALRRRYA